MAVTQAKKKGGGSMESQYWMNMEFPDENKLGRM